MSCPSRSSWTSRRDGGAYPAEHGRRLRLPAPTSPMSRAATTHAMHLARFSFFAWAFPSWLMSIASRCPPGRAQGDHRGLRRRRGRRHGRRRPLPHRRALRRGGGLRRLSRDEVVALQPSATIKACIHAWNDLATNYPWEVSYAAISGLEMGSTTQAVELAQEDHPRDDGRRRSPKRPPPRSPNPSRAHRRRPGDARVRRPARLPAQFHGGGGLAMLLKYGTNREKQEQMISGGAHQHRTADGDAAPNSTASPAPEVGLPPAC